MLTLSSHFQARWARDFKLHWPEILSAQVETVEALVGHVSGGPISYSDYSKTKSTTPWEAYSSLDACLHDRCRTFSSSHP